MSRIITILIFSICAITITATCGDRSSTLAGYSDMSGVWGVFISKESMVSSSGVRTNPVSACDTEWNSSDPDTGIEVWQISQSGSNLVAIDAANPVEITTLATGLWSGGRLTLTGTSGTWSAAANLRMEGCCFDAVGSDGRHFHAIKMTGVSDGGTSDACRTGKDEWEANLVINLDNGSQVITTSAGDVEYAVWGNSGPYILTFHGGQGGYDQIRAFAPGIIGRGYRVLTWSRPGYLRTPMPADGISTMEDQADLAAALLDALGIDRVAAFGGSAGGPPLFLFALRHPDRLTAVIAESAVSTTYTPHGDYPYVNELVYLFVNPGGMWIYNSMFEYATEATTRILLRTISTLDEASFNAWVAGIMASPTRTESVKTILVSMSPSTQRMMGTGNDLYYDAQLGNMPLAGITAPTLIVHGTNDGDVDPSNAIYSAATIPGAQLHWVVEGSHVLELADDIAAVNQVELDFLNQHKP